MSFLFHSAPPSYAEEKLSSHLSSISTIPLQISTTTSLSSGSSSTSNKPAQPLESALHKLSSSRPLTREKLIEVLQGLTRALQDIGGGAGGYSVESEVDKVVEAEIIGRGVTMVWKEVLETLLASAVRIEQERNWWDGSLNTRRGVVIYLLQTLPHRFFTAIQPISFNLSLPSLQAFKFPSRSALFKPLHASTSSALTSIMSPYVLTRREMFASRKALTAARNETASRIGLLASQGPQWSPEDSSFSDGNGNGYGYRSSDLLGESSRVYGILCQALDVPPPPAPTPVSSRRSRSSTSNQASLSSQPTANATNLLSILTVHLPKYSSNLDEIMKTHKRPSQLTRLWFPLLFVPPTLYITLQTIGRNKQWMKDQVRNAKETVKGFVIQWVWEPIEDIAKTIRGGGEGLGVAPTTVESDKASLERMVQDLGRDYYHLSGPALEDLGNKVRRGDMEEVLRVYEKELQSPLKNALMGSLVRTLLIQVQKTKTDLSLSLLSLDHLLRSQQLTFAFVGVAPSFLILYGLGGWARGIWRGEKRGKARRRTYFHGLRDVERLLITSPKDEQEMLDRDRGLLIVSVSGMRSWATGLGGSNREAFLNDLRMVEDPSLRRVDKLRVVERIWRCWGVDGRGRGP